MKQSIGADPGASAATRAAWGYGVLGFLSWAVAAVVVAGAYLGGVRPFGWRGGEFAEAYLWIALACMAVGGVLLLSRRGRWRGFGAGLLTGALVGFAVAGAILALFFWAFSRSDNAVVFAP